MSASQRGPRRVKPVAKDASVETNAVSISAVNTGFAADLAAEFLPATAKGWMDEQPVTVEILNFIRRAGRTSFSGIPWKDT